MHVLSQQGSGKYLRLDFEFSLEFGDPVPILVDGFTYVTQFILEMSIFSSDPAQILHGYFLLDKNHI